MNLTLQWEQPADWKRNPTLCHSCYERIGRVLFECDEAASRTARDEGAVQGFADCEALVAAMLTTMSDSKAASGATCDATLLRSAARDVQLGQHRTDAYDAEALATAHRKAAQNSLAVKGGRSRMLAQSPERRKEIATIASNAALTARRARAKDARRVFLDWQAERIDNSTFADRMQSILRTQSPDAPAKGE